MPVEEEKEKEHRLTGKAERATSMGTTRGVGFLARIGGAAPRVHRQPGSGRFQFEHGREYDFRLSYWAPFEEALFEIADRTGPSRWSYLQRDVKPPPGETFWLCVVLHNKVGTPDPASVVSIEIPSLAISTP